MSDFISSPSRVQALNQADPINQMVELGTKLNQIITLVNELRTDMNALVAKLDTDAANTQLNDTNYAATCGISSSAVDTL